jgi:polysaccharide pyruvyl transferase WcaK-like protein
VALKNIFLIGYFGFGNVGDELLLKQFVTFIKRDFPELLVQVWGEPTEWTGDLKVDWAPRKKLWQCFQSYLKSDTIVFSGGGLWQDHSGRGLTALVYYACARLTELLGKKIVFFNQGIDGLKQNWLEQRILDLFARSPIAFLRETSQPYSLLNAAAWVHIMPDALWATPFKRVVERGDNLGVCLSQALPESDLKSLLGYLQEQKHFRKITLFNFYPHADSKVVEQARAVLDTFHQVTVVQGVGILERMAQCQKIIGARYHSVILAQLLGVPFWGVFAELKSQRLCEQLQLPYWMTGQLTPKVQKNFSDWLKNPATVPEALFPDLILRSQKSWEKLKHALQTL